MRRREFIVLLSAALPSLVLAQQSTSKRRIAVLMPYAESDPAGLARVRSFQDGLRSLGWLEASNNDLRYCYAADVAQIENCALSLVKAAPDVIVVNSTPAGKALGMEVSPVLLNRADRVIE